MTLFVVATPIGNLEDITYRAVRVLGSVAKIAAEDTRAAQRILERYGIARPQLVSFFEGNEAGRTAALVGELLAGVDVALISEAGTPGVSDPGQRLVAAAREAGVKIEVLPGPSAAITGLVASGLPTDRFLFVGFPPRDEGPRQELFGGLRAEPGSLIFYEAPGRVGATLADLAAALGGARQARLARELTKIHEEVVGGTLDEPAARYAGEPPRGECTIVVAGATSALEPIDLEAAVRQLLAEGVGPKEIAARLALKTGKPRRAIYQLALALK